MIDPDSERPVYRQIADELRVLIASGHYGPGQMLPSSRQLEQTYGYSRETIKRVLSVLRSEGLVVTERGHGSRVRVPDDRTQVRAPSRATIRAREATDDERRRLGIREGGFVQVVTVDGHESVYDASAVELTTP